MTVKIVYLNGYFEYVRKYDRRLKLEVSFN